MGWLEDLNPLQLFNPQRWQQGQDAQWQSDAANNLQVPTVAQHFTNAAAPIADAITRNNAASYNSMNEGHARGGNGLFNAGPTPIQPAASTGPSQGLLDIYKQQQTDANEFRGSQAAYQDENRKMQERLGQARSAWLTNNPFKRAENPYGDNNAGYQGMMSGIAGRVGSQLANLEQGTMADAARRGINTGSGAYGQMQNQNNRWAAGQQSSQLNDATMQNFDRRNAFDQSENAAERQYQQATNNALDNFDFAQADRLKGLMNDRNTQAMLNPGRNLDLMSGYQGFNQEQAMNPYRQEAARLSNAGQGLNNTHQDYLNQFQGAVLPDQINAGRAGYQYDAANAGYAGSMAKDNFDFLQQHKPQTDALRNLQFNTNLFQGAVDNGIDGSALGLLGRNKTVQGLGGALMQGAKFMF